MREPPCDSNGFYAEHAQLLARSFARFVGQELLSPKIDDPTEYARQLFEAPYVVLSHGTQPDPIFNYANRTAMELFELDWAAITCLPSRESAEPMNRSERERLLAAVAEHKFIDDYAGVRISSTGKRFYIPQATVWNLVDAEGAYQGQAATFATWDFL